MIGRAFLLATAVTALAACGASTAATEPPPTATKVTTTTEHDITVEEANDILTDLEDEDVAAVTGLAQDYLNDCLTQMYLQTMYASDEAEIVCDIAKGGLRAVDATSVSIKLSQCWVAYYEMLMVAGHPTENMYDPYTSCVTELAAMVDYTFLPCDQTGAEVTCEEVWG